MDRVQNAVVKLARGHLDYELSIQERDDPDEIDVVPLALMSQEHRGFFEYPEPGISPFCRNWAQGPSCVCCHRDHGNFVQIVFSEYLACSVVRS